MPGKIVALAGGFSAYALDAAPNIYRPGQHGEDASYKGPNIILAGKLPASMTHKQHAEEAGRRLKNGQILTCGAWTVIDRLLQDEAKEVEKGFVEGHYERSGTVRVYSKKPGDLHTDEGWVWGFVVDHPLFDDNGNVVFDSEGAPKGEYAFRVPLPLKSGCLKELPPATQDAIDMLHGIKGASKTLPDYAYLSSYPEAGVSDNVRGGWLYGSRGGGRVGVDGYWGPSGSLGGVASRGAASGVLKRSIGDEEISRLEAQRREAAEVMKRIDETLAGAVWDIE